MKKWPVAIILYLSDTLNHLLGIHRIPWTSRNYKAIILHAGKIMVPWNQMYFGTSLGENQRERQAMRGAKEQMNVCLEAAELGFQPFPCQEQ